MLTMGWAFVIFTTLLLCGGLAYTILEFRRVEARLQAAVRLNGDKLGETPGRRR